MPEPEISLERLVAERRSHAANDVEFAQRLALACIAIFEQHGGDSEAALRRAFRIH